MEQPTVKICALCDEGQVHLEFFEDTLDVNGRPAPLRLAILCCDVCKGEYAGAEENALNAAEVRRVRQELLRQDGTHA